MDGGGGVVVAALVLTAVVSALGDVYFKGSGGNLERFTKSLCSQTQGPSQQPCRHS